MKYFMKPYRKNREKRVNITLANLFWIGVIVAILGTYFYIIVNVVQ